MTNIIDTMNPEVVRSTIRERGTKFATVTFIKADGTERTINGLFRPSSKIVGSERGMAVGDALRAKGLIPIYSLADKGWRSFREDAVVEIK